MEAKKRAAAAAAAAAHTRTHMRPHIRIMRMLQATFRRLPRASGQQRARSYKERRRRRKEGEWEIKANEKKNPPSPPPFPNVSNVFSFSPLNNPSLLSSLRDQGKGGGKKGNEDFLSSLNRFLSLLFYFFRHILYLPFFFGVTFRKGKKVFQYEGRRRYKTYIYIFLRSFYVMGKKGEERGKKGKAFFMWRVGFFFNLKLYSLPFFYFVLFLRFFVLFFFPAATSVFSGRWGECRIKWNPYFFF
jgi:hypothetical protein